MKDWIRSPSPDLDEELARLEQEEEERKARMEALLAGNTESTVASPTQDSEVRHRPFTTSIDEQWAGQVDSANYKRKMDHDAASPGCKTRKLSPSAKASRSPCKTPFPTATRALRGSHKPRQNRLMALSQMCLKTVLAHLSDLSEDDVADVTSSALPLLSPRFADPLQSACASHLAHLERLDRAKRAALAARDKEQRQRPSSVALLSEGPLPSMTSRAGGRKPRVEKSKGGQKIWKKARMAAGPSSSSTPAARSSGMSSHFSRPQPPPFLTAASRSLSSPSRLAASSASAAMVAGPSSQSKHLPRPKSQVAPIVNSTVVVRGAGFGGRS
ncbi:unnamed protein product [Parajaminaea phylloscopi]